MNIHFIELMFSILLRRSILISYQSWPLWTFLCSNFSMLDFNSESTIFIWNFQSHQLGIYRCIKNKLSRQSISECIQYIRLIVFNKKFKWDLFMPKIESIHLHYYFFSTSLWYIDGRIFFTKFHAPLIR